MEFEDPMVHGYRRIVTGLNAASKSVVVSDDEVNVGPLGMIEFWKSSGVPCSLTEDGTKLLEPVRLEPPKGGVVFRFFQIPPQDPALTNEEAKQKATAEFASAGASHCRVDTTRNPMMHTTSTIDYVVLLSGKVSLLLDEGEVQLKPFDAVIQRGTNHYWINHGNEPALLMGVLIDAKQ